MTTLLTQGGSGQTADLPLWFLFEHAMRAAAADKAEALPPSTAGGGGIGEISREFTEKGSELYAKV